MKFAFAIVLFIHAAIHLMGAAKAFGWAPVPIEQQISPFMGTVWLLAAICLVCTAGLLLVWPQGWWIVGVAAVVLSQLAIIAAWKDARVGTAPNLLLVLAVAYGFLLHGPFSFNLAYRNDVARNLLLVQDAQVLIDTDLAHLPPLVSKYIRASGAVGRPRVRNFRAHFSGRIRSGPAARWMPFTGEQVNTMDPPSRLFLMDATMMGLPLQAYHRYVGANATMRVKAAGLVNIVSVGGPVMNKGETVTLFNDLCFFAPAGLVDRRIAWEPLGVSSVRATYINGAHTIHAVLTFGATGNLVNFYSDDRPSLAADGKTAVPMRWSTPVRSYGDVGGFHLPKNAEGVYDAPAGPYVYIEFEIHDVAYNIVGNFKKPSW